MRPSSLGLLATLLVVPSLAAAGERGGGGSGGGSGRLGQVTSGIDKAATSGSERGGGSSPVSLDASDHEGELYHRRYEGQHLVVVARDGTVVRRTRVRSMPSAGPARVDLFVGIQKVVESDRSYALALAVEDKWFRIAGAVSEYREQQMDGTRTALTLPTLMFGARVLGGGPTRGYLEGGVAIARTREDGVTGSSLTGPIVGVHLEHSLGGPSFVGDLHAMAFEAGVKAYSGRIGVRVSHLELGFRVLDFNVGPALFGPEVGLQF